MFWDALTHWFRRRHETAPVPAGGDDPVRELMRRRAARQDEPGVVLGMIEGEQGHVPFKLTRSEALAHGLVLGETGAGKTSWALTVAEQLLGLGHSVAALSPHPDLGDGFVQIAARAGVPCAHIDFGGRAGAATPWTFLKVSGARPDEVALLAQSVFASAFGAGGPAGYIRTTLGPLFLLLASFPDELSLLDCERLVQDPGFTRSFLDQLPALLPEAQHFFASLAGKSRSATLQAARFGLARVNSLLSLRGPRLTLCGSDPLDLRDVLRRQAVVVVSVPAATLGDSAGLLAGLFLEILRLVLLQRPVGSSEPPVHVMVDELGTLAAHAERLGAFLAEARKVGGFAIGMAQHMAQLETNRALLGSFLSNARLLVLGRISHADARRFGGLPPLPHRSRGVRMQGPWIDGVDMTFESPTPPGEDVEQVLTSLDRREFVVATPLGGRPTTTRIRSLKLRTSTSERSPQFLGARPTAEVEREIDDRLRSHAPSPVSVAAPTTRQRPTPRGGPPTPAPSQATPAPASSLPSTPVGPPRPRGPVNRF